MRYKEKLDLDWTYDFLGSQNIAKIAMDAQAYIAASYTRETICVVDNF